MGFGRDSQQDLEIEMANIKISAVSREIQGRGASRRLRKIGLIPGILYGGVEPTIQIELEHKMLLMRLGNESFQSSIITLEMEGKEEEVLLRDYQMHPWKKQVLHVDFQRVSADKLINMNVPLHFINEELAPGVKIGGGIVNHVLTELAIQCLPSKLPKYIEVDLSGLEVGQSLHLSELTLPDGVEAVVTQKSEDTAVANVQVPRAIVEEVVSGDEAEAVVDGPEEDSDSENTKEGDS